MASRSAGVGCSSSSGACHRRVAVLIACDPRVLQRRLHSDVATGKSLANVNMAIFTQILSSVG